MNKKVYWYIDDVIWPFRDIARDRPASIFDQHLLKLLKELHDKYGFKVALNSFYRTDYAYGDEEFTLADMPDTYKAEWEANSDWLKIGYHSKQEFPDYPLINISYDDMKNEYLRFEKEVTRFAGKNVLIESINPHWWPVSKEGCRALSDCGIKLISCTTGTIKDDDKDADLLPFGHAFRLFQNRKPESKIYNRAGVGVDICSYNHLTEEESSQICGTFKTIYKEDTDIHFKYISNGVCLNSVPLEQIDERLELAMGSEYVCCATHEQYAYPDYCNYQSDTREKFIKACEMLKENNYEYFFVDECLK